MEKDLIQHIYFFIENKKEQSDELINFGNSDEKSIGFGMREVILELRQIVNNYGKN